MKGRRKRRREIGKDRGTGRYMSGKEEMEVIGIIL